MQEVNASSVQQDNAIHDIARQAIEINEISQQLFEDINIFKKNSGLDEERRARTDGESSGDEAAEELPYLTISA